jgi:hypothetical protein
MTAKESSTFRIFVSSTFRDLKAERNALQESVFPRLRELCAQHGARFQAIDLRWGVSEEASLDQQTMNICLGEIERCQQVTPRPNFILLLGDRYGWMPPLPQIPADEFENILNKIVNPNDQELLQEWYRRDDNSVPPEYCLQPREGEMALYEHWEPVERHLHQVLENAALNLDLWSDNLIKYTASATEQEIVDGAMRVADARDHVFCFFREIEGLPGDVNARGYIDFDSEDKRDLKSNEKLQDLKTRLEEYIPENTHHYRAQWQGGSATLDHVDQLCEDVYQRLSVVILAELALLEKVDPLDSEIEAHDAFGEERAGFFTGRVAILERIDGYIQGEDLHPFAIWGESGSGKSALLARAVQQAQETYDDEGCIIYRFIGYTPESSNGRALLESLCRQISRRYGASEDDIPLEFRELTQEFPKRLALAAWSGFRQICRSTYAWWSPRFPTSAEMHCKPNCPQST